MKNNSKQLVCVSFTQHAHPLPWQQTPFFFFFKNNLLKCEIRLPLNPSTGSNSKLEEFLFHSSDKPTNGSRSRRPIQTKCKLCFSRTLWELGSSGKRKPPLQLFPCSVEVLEEMLSSVSPGVPGKRDRADVTLWQRANGPRGSETDSVGQMMFQMASG